MNKSQMPSRRCRRPMLLAALCLLLLLTGCGSKEAAERQQAALEYYQAKYGVEDVTVTYAHKDGYHDGLFGYAGSKDMAYGLSDGHTVYYHNGSASFADDAQSDLICSDFEREILAPLLSDFSAPMETTPLSLYQSGFEVFDKNLFAAYYDGDIHSYLKNTPIHLYFDIALEAAEEEACEQEVARFYESLRGLVHGQVSVFFLNSGLRELAGGDWSLGQRSRIVDATADLDFDSEITWSRNIFVEVFDGLFVSFQKEDFVLEEGDLVLEEVGTCAELQQLLDEAYFALPVDAEGSQNNAHKNEDQRHQSRYILDDPDAPCYRVRLSQRLRDLLDGDNGITVYILDQRDGGAPLLQYVGNWRVFPAWMDQPDLYGIADFDEDYYYCFGTYHTVPYGGSGAAGEEAQDKNG